MNFSEKLKELRKDKGWTQEELAEKIATDKRQVSFYENGKYIPSSETLSNIAKTFNVSIDYLIFDDIPKHNLYSDYVFFQKINELDNLSENDKQLIIGLIDSLTEKNKIRTLALQIS